MSTSAGWLHRDERKRSGDRSRQQCPGREQFGRCLEGSKRGEKGCQAGVGSWLVKRCRAEPPQRKGSESWGEVGEERAELADRLRTRRKATAL